MDRTASLKKESTVGRENPILVPPVPTKNGIEKAYFFVTTFPIIETSAARDRSIRCCFVNALSPGKNRIANIIKGNSTIYLSCVYMLTLANKIPAMIPLCFSEG